MYREVGAALGASPAALGSLTLCRALVQAMCYPLAAVAAARHDGSRVVAVGAFLWAAATMLIGVWIKKEEIPGARGWGAMPVRRWVRSDHVEGDKAGVSGARGDVVDEEDV